MDEPRLPIDSVAYTRAANEFFEKNDYGHDRLSLQIGLMLVRISNQFVHDSEKKAQRPFGLRWSSLAVTFALLLFRSLEASTLAKLTGVTRQAMSLVTATLERNGLVRKETGADRRARPIELTEEGREAVNQAMERQGSLSEEWFNPLSQDERVLLYSLLEKVQAGRGVKSVDG